MINKKIFFFGFIAYVLVVANCVNGMYALTITCPTCLKSSFTRQIDFFELIIDGKFAKCLKDIQEALAQAELELEEGQKPPLAMTTADIILGCCDRHKLAIREFSPLNAIIGEYEYYKCKKEAGPSFEKYYAKVLSRFREAFYLLIKHKVFDPTYTYHLKSFLAHQIVASDNEWALDILLAHQVSMDNTDGWYACVPLSMGINKLANQRKHFAEIPVSESNKRVCAARQIVKTYSMVEKLIEATSASAILAQPTWLISHISNDQRFDKKCTDFLSKLYLLRLLPADPSSSLAPIQTIPLEVFDTIVRQAYPSIRLWIKRENQNSKKIAH